MLRRSSLTTHMVAAAFVPTIGIPFGPVSKRRSMAFAMTIKLDASREDIRGPHCRLLDQKILSRYVKAYSSCTVSTRDVQRAVNGDTHDDMHRMANRLIKNRQRGLAEWIYLRALARGRKSMSETLFLLALLVQKRDSEVARCAFRLAVQFGHDIKGKAKHMLAWGLFESKHCGRIKCARSLLRRSVTMDQTLSPVLKWKVFIKDERQLF